MTDPTNRRALPARLWTGFARFRRTRPFWGSLVLALGGYYIAAPLLGGSMSFYTSMGARTITPLLLGGGIIAAAGVALLSPAQRHFPAIVAAMLAVASLPLANLGGWVVGMVLGIVGAGLVFAWTPYTDEQLRKIEDRQWQRARRRMARRGADPDGADPGVAEAA